MTTNTTQLQGKTLEPEPILLDRNDVLDAVALFCSHFETLGERFKKQLRNTIRAIPPARRAAVAGPRRDALKFAEEVVGTVFDNTGASHETLKATMIERITDACAATSSPTPAERTQEGEQG